MVRTQRRYNRQTAAHRQDECESSSVRTSSDDEDDSEGSLADFIEHDSDEGNGDESYDNDSNETGEDESEDQQVTRQAKRARLIADEENEDEGDVEETTTEEDADEVIKRQYRPEMETMCGSIITDTGVRRSMRSNKGRAPVRYVDDDYAELMLEDVASEDREALVRELSDSDEDNADDADASVEDLAESDGSDS